MLRNLSVIFLILLLAYGQAGYFFVIRHQQQEQKEIMKEKIFSQLADNEFEMVHSETIPAGAWEEPGKEFILDGKMYDVVKKKQVNGKTVFFCINDKKEKMLVDRYNRMTNHNSTEKKSITPDNVTLYLDDDLLPVLPVASAIRNYLPYHRDAIRSFTALHTPPPKC